jgi:hypothetical protein
MQQVLAILLGALCSGGTSLCFGAFLLRRLHLELERTEYAALAFVTGSACYSQLVFLFSATSLARPYVFIAVGLLAALFIVCTRGNVSHTTFARFPTRWKWLFGALFACFGIVYLVNALAPEMSPDGSAYHLPFVTHYLRAHGFTRIDQNLYANLPQGIDLLFLPAVSLGGNSGASMVHFLFLLDLPLLMAAMAGILNSPCRQRPPHSWSSLRRRSDGMEPRLTWMWPRPRSCSHCSTFCECGTPEERRISWLPSESWPVFLSRPNTAPLSVFRMHWGWWRGDSGGTVNPGCGPR